MDHAPAPLKIKIQIHCGDDIAMGPGKADLLDAIAMKGRFRPPRAAWE
jgi:molybdate transport system regulatory protein